MWRKLGLVHVPRGEQAWAATHAYIPTAWMPDEERIRIYSASRDAAGIGRVGFVDLAARDPRRVLNVSARPALDIGQAGAFDDNGVTPVCVLEHEGRLYLYYIGWQLGVRVRYFLFSGLAVSADGGETFTRHSQAPILDRRDGELVVRSAPSVIRDGDRWKMWYIAGDSWTQVAGQQVPTYNVRYMESDTPTDWGKGGEVCMDLANDDEFGFGRPFVIRENGLFKMWYSIRRRSKGYRLGYAESLDGRSWTRKDAEVGVDVSPSGWDSEMICCACVQRTAYGTYMFYNGNNYGETGFGVARWQD